MSNAQPLKQIQLQKPADWTVWLSFIRMIAENDDVWNLINPDLIERPENILKPQAPVYQGSRGANIDLEAYNQWKAQMGLHRADLAEYEKQRESMKQLIKQIQSSISADAAVLIANESSHPYNLLRALKLRFAPTDQTRKIQIEAKYHELCKGPGNQDREMWLDAWRETYITGKALNVYEMTQERPIRDFIYSIMDQDEAWANAHLALIDEEIKEDSLFNLISKFRNHTRMKSSRKLHQSAHSAFSASAQPNQPSQQSNGQPNQANQNQPVGRGRGGGDLSYKGKQQPQECLCGEMHWWVDCIYLNPAKRPYNWHEQADPETAKRVNEAMKNSDTKDYIENAIRRAMEKRTQNNQINQNQNQTHPPEAPSAFVADQQYYGVFTTAIASNNPLLFSWILDNGSDTHVCNKTMLHRFRKTRDAPPENILDTSSIDQNINLTVFDNLTSGKPIIAI